MHFHLLSNIYPYYATSLQISALPIIPGWSKEKNTMSIYILKLNFTTRKSKYPCSFPFDKTLNPAAKQIREHDLFGCTHAWKRKKNSSNKTLTRTRTRRMAGVFLPPHVRQCPRDIYTHTHTQPCADNTAHFVPIRNASYSKRKSPPKTPVNPNKSQIKFIFSVCRLTI